METKIAKMSLAELNTSRILISMSADITKEEKKEIYNLMDERERKLNLVATVVTSEILPSEFGDTDGLDN